MHYDLIIVGGGLVGASLALSLRSLKWRIALIEATSARSDDPRLFGLTASSCQFLKNLNLWQQLADYATPIHQVHVSYQGCFGAIRLHHTDVHVPQLGYVIPARYIEAALHAELILKSNVDYYCKATVQALQQANLIALTVQTDVGEKLLQSPIVIAADGAESTIRKQLNIETEIIDYQQSAIVTQTFLQRSHHYIAYERLNARGAIAMLPLLDNKCATIFTADHATITQFMALSDEAFVALLQKEFGYRLGRFEKIAKRYVFPLKMVQAKENIRQGVLLLGNAAHALHPIAAQGFNLALYEVAILSDAIRSKVIAGQLFSQIDLEKAMHYTHRQRSFSIFTSHQLAQLSKYHSPLLNMCLSLGMVGLDNIKPMKEFFINKMIGMAS